MKLVKSFTTRKKRQLLLEPPPPPCCSVSTAAVAAAAATNDNDDDDDDGYCGGGRDDCRGGGGSFKSGENLKTSSKFKRHEPEYHNTASQQVATMIQRKSAAGSRGDKNNSSRRKSELTSFLTVLFGALLLAGTSQLIWATQAASGLAGPNATSVASSARRAETPIGEPDGDVEEDEGESAEPANKLASVLTDAARDGADLLLARLQGTKDDDAAPTEERDIDQPAGDEELAEGERANSTLARPVAAPSVLSAEEEKNAAREGGDTKLALETYAKWRSAGDDLIELFSRKLMPIIVEHGYDVDAGTVTGLLQVFNGIRQLKPWALRLLDAWAKLSPGILRGTQSDFGDFDECINIRADDPNGLAAADTEHFPNGGELDPETGLRSTTLVGRYCLADIEFPKPARVRARNQHENNNFSSTSPTAPFEPIELRRPLLDFDQQAAFKDTIFVETGNFFHMLYVDPMRVGLCLTNKIDPLSFQQVFNKLLEEFRVTINFRGRCVTKYDKRILTTYQRVSLYVLLVVCSLVVLSTLADLFHRKINKFPWPRRWLSLRVKLHVASTKYCDVFTSFSLVRNTERLFKQPPASGATSQLTSGTRSNVDSSVESSPSIGRRSSAESTKDLISLQHSTTSSDALCKSQSSSSASAAVAAASADSSLPSLGLDQVNLRSLHGIRVITMVWMIVNHTYMFGGFFVLWAYRRLIDIAEWPKSLSFQLVLNGWLTVETYFFLSAMIIVLGVMPVLRRGKFNYFLYIFHRLIRLAPAYVGLVCLNFLWPLISSGPVWLVKGKSFVQDPCEQYLWANFLFINNWFWPEKQCMVHTWFLSADFQLYIVAPIIVYLFYRRPALGHWLNLVVALLASILSGAVIYANKLLPTTLINKLEFDAIKQQLSYSYFATYQHAGPYCLGLLVGYLLHKRPRVHLPRYLTWSLWLLLPPLSITTLLLTYLWNGAYPEDNLINPSPLVSALYVAIHRTIWTALLAWLVFACATGRARLLSSFLSSSIFVPLSRLSYSIYLVHLPVIMFRALNLRHTLDWTDQNILWESCGNFVVSSMLGYFLYVAFECPMINLERSIFKRNGQATRSISEQLTKNKLMMATDFSAKSIGHHLDKQMSFVEPTSLSTATLGDSQKSYSTASSSSSDTVTDDRNMPQRSSSSGQPQMRSTRARQQFGVAADAATCQKRAPQEEPRRDSGEINNGDDLYNISGEYGHYAPGSYTQWRRARGQIDLNAAPHRQKLDYPANSSSMRAMQYATLARANRSNTRWDQASSRQLASDVEHRLDGYQQRWDSFASSQDYAMSRSELKRDHHNSLFPNSSELGLSARPTTTTTTTSTTSRLAGAHDDEDDDLGEARLRANDLHGHRMRRRLGRYNTLTGSGAHEWSSQLQAPHNYNYNYSNNYSNNYNQQMAAMLAGSGGGTPFNAGSLLIPRVDWSLSTMRRPTRASNMVPTSSTGGSQQQDEAKIVEEEEANEVSVL